MLKVQDGNARSFVSAADKMIGDMDVLVAGMKQALDQYDQLRERFDQLNREHQQVREGEERLRAEREEATEALAELRAAYEALLVQYENNSQALCKLGEERDTLLRAREEIVGGIRTALDSLRA
jgi:chromosome segregation ATPase